MRSPISYLEVKDYFGNLVANSTFIEEFVGFSEREWNSRKASRAGLQSPTLALFRYELGFDSPEEKASAVRKVAFAMMLKVAKPENYQAQYEAINTAEKYALKVLARINYDSNKTGHVLWNAFIKGSVVINPVELSANDFGVEVFFNLKNPQPLKLELEDWTDITELCP